MSGNGRDHDMIDHRVVGMMDGEFTPVAWMDHILRVEPHVLDRMDELAVRRGVDAYSDPDGLYRLLVDDVFDKVLETDR